jgi:hypothetical protein
MSNTNPIPLRTLPHFNEASAQRSLRDSDAVPRQWKKNSQTNAQIRSVSQNVHHIQRQIDRMRFYKGSGTEPQTIYYPFKVIPSPVMSNTYRAAFSTTADGGSASAGDALIIAQGGSIPITEDLQWRTFRVRAGRIGDDWGKYVHQTDGVNSDPDDTTDVGTMVDYTPWQDDGSAGCDFTVPKDSEWFYVYVDRSTISAGEWYVRLLDGTSSSGITFGDGNYILIATINTSTYALAQRAIIRQYVRTDLMEPAIVCNPYA